jgi:hypothetical protein
MDFFFCDCCFVLSGSGLYEKLITLPEESYRPWCVLVCDLETSWMRRPWPTGAVAPKINKYMPDDKQLDSISLDSRRPPRCGVNGIFAPLGVQQSKKTLTARHWKMGRIDSSEKSVSTNLRYVPSQNREDLKRNFRLTVLLQEISKAWSSYSYVMLMGSCRQATACRNAPALSAQAYTHFYIIIHNIWRVF